jgi:predicted metal-dependent HD superfamily phosphohydrolase
MPAAQAWQAAVAVVGGDPAPAAAAAHDLARRWAEPHRRYHTTTHLDSVLHDTAWLGDEVGLDSQQRAVVTLAACAHDVVYAGRPGADERASADWARERLTACRLADRVVDRVAALVLATADHRSDPDDLEAATLLDADLAVLGSSPADYASYFAAVRAEYAGLAEDQWRTGRTWVVHALLERDPLYRIPTARRRWQTQARQNLAAELTG